MDRKEVAFLLVHNEHRMKWALVITALIFLAKLVGGYLTNSLALISDAWHLLTDVLALLLSWMAIKQSQKGATPKHTFGYHRFGILAALVNNLSLIFISIYIFYQAFLRLFNPQPVAVGGMFILAVLGLASNILIIWCLQGGEKNLNVKSALLHFIGDALASVGVIIGGIVIYFTGWYPADTIISALIGGMILKGAWEMLVEIVQILLEGVPPSIDVRELTQNLRKIEKVKDVTDIHVWSLSSEQIAMSAHVCVENITIEESYTILQRIQKMLRQEYNIGHTTIQFEAFPCASCFHGLEGYACALCIDSQSLGYENT